MVITLPWTALRLASGRYGKYTNWAEGLNRVGAPEHDPSKVSIVPGALVSPTSDGTINWEPQTFSPDTGLLYVAEKDGFSILYLTDVDPRGSMGLGGREEAEVGSEGSFLTAIDYKTAKVAWRRPYHSDGGGGGCHEGRIPEYYGINAPG